MSVLTRYLYNLEEVKLSYLIALLNKDLKRAYHWIFEIYHSGYQQDAFELNEVLYANVYVRRKTIMEKNKQRYGAWSLDKDPIHIATIVKNMINQPIRISKFIGKIWKINNIKDVSVPTPSKAYLTATYDEIAEYNTLDSAIPSNVLKIGPKYGINKELHMLFKIPNVSKEEWEQNWLYYASSCPLWKERIQQYGGTVCSNKMRVEFCDDKQFEQFYDRYNYEPDEQPNNIQEMIYGKDDASYNYLDIPTLCRFYGGIQ